jgi:hypothetical protein
MKQNLLLALAATALAVPAFATTGVDDGLSYNAASNGAGMGHFSNPNAAYPFYRTSWVGDGWSTEGAACDFYTATRGAYSWSGVYDYDDYKWICVDGAAKPITIIADVEMWCQEIATASEVYFHFGRGQASQSDAFITVTLNSNNGQWWGVSKGTWGQNDQADADNLKYLEDGFGRTTQGPGTNGSDQDIPLQWAISENSGPFTPGQWTGGNNLQDWGYFWLIDGGNPGSHTFQLRMRITPNAYQNDGRYYLDPHTVVKPVL